MSPTRTAHVLTDLMECIALADSRQRGALWALAEPARQLATNLIRLPAGAVVDEHRENDLDVLLLVVAGTGVLRDGTRSTPLAVGTLVWLPRLSWRGLRAGPEGLAYVTAHQRRDGLTIRRAEQADAPNDEGGETACWVHRICPACGAVPDGVAPAYCSRCGERLGID
jgi:quercetin dioxygenase-like cupin family protein